MFRCLCALLAFTVCVTAPAVADQSGEMPHPIAQYAEKLERECRAGGHGSLVTTDIYSDRVFDRPDINRDGKPDYFIYTCMFGCSDKPQKFMGTGGPCPTGTLLLSKEGSYQEVFLPGVVQEVSFSEGLRIKVQLPQSLRLIENYCSDGFADHDPSYVYEFKDGRFQRVAMCPPGNCAGLLN